LAATTFIHEDYRTCLTSLKVSQELHKNFSGQNYFISFSDVVTCKSIFRQALFNKVWNNF